MVGLPTIEQIQSLRDWKVERAGGVEDLAFRLHTHGRRGAALILPKIMPMEMSWKLIPDQGSVSSLFPVRRHPQIESAEAKHEDLMRNHHVEWWFERIA